MDKIKAEIIEKFDASGHVRSSRNATSIEKGKPKPDSVVDFQEKPTLNNVWIDEENLQSRWRNIGHS